MVNFIKTESVMVMQNNRNLHKETMEKRFLWKQQRRL